MHELLEDPEALARHGGWSAEVYTDFLALQAGRMGREAFDAKYLRTRAVLTLDMTGFTRAAIELGALDSLLRIFDVQKVCVPVLRDGGAERVRTHADDIVALFEDPGRAVDAALEMHSRVAAYHATHPDDGRRAECCIGIGYGPLYAIGPDLAQGDEMNRSSRLGEDIARGGETLVTENVRVALAGRDDLMFRPQTRDDAPFPFFRVGAP